jgi:hypothetical protein
MAIRYSGDVEVKMQYDQERRAYRGVVRDPNGRWRGTASANNAPTTETYDDLARAMIERAEKEQGRKLPAERQGRRIMVRRVFQAPCPYGPWEES